MNDYKPIHTKQQWKLKLRVKYANRRAKRFGASGRFTKETVVNLYDRQKGRCACCGVLLNFYFSIDHITPLSKGGDNLPENLQLLTPLCNTSKGSKSMAEFLQIRSMFSGLMLSEVKSQ